jgi:outer membrane protein assembly factor BamB
MRISTALLTACALVGLSAAAPAYAADPAVWTQDAYGPGHTGYNPAESVINTGSIAKLKLRWTAKPGPGQEGCEPTPSVPLVYGGRMFILDSGTVGAYDVKTGKRLWLFGVPYVDAADLAIVDGLVIATEVNCFSNSNYDTNVVAINPVTGKMVWDSLQGYSINSHVGDQGVFVVSGFCGICDDERYGVTAFRVSDGKRLWQRVNYVLAGPVSAGGHIVLRSTRDPEIEVVKIKNGGTVWGTGAWQAAAANPAGDQLYLFNSAGVAAVDAKTAKAKWTIKHESGDLISDGKRVFVASANRINAYSATTGKLAWTRAIASPRHLIRAGGLLYGLSKKTLVILSPTTGKTVVSGAAYGPLTDHVVATGGRLYTTNGSTVRSYTP